ncbi:DUF4258 domain-containing protein [Aeromonas sp. ARM81]|uniref:DUF4258 domain-containing protein n=1 Tax=Aeromonas sp. ARM81 TaxID=1747384 RepID=UPI000DF7902E|nr:DUF4258 domain-containing protein [Aeromonas sp. ARM81]RDD49102.1 hypothetical protein ASJ36_15730 [Aeromonas sp. ARM81]
MKQFTKHAEKRSQQRCISMAMVTVLDALGVETHQKGNTFKSEMTCNREMRQNLRDIGKLLIYMVDHNVYSIEDCMNEVITVGHKHA